MLHVVIMSSRHARQCALGLTAAMLVAAATATGPLAGRVRADQQAPEVDALLARIDDLYRSRSSIARIDILMTTPRTTRSQRLKAWNRAE